MITIQDYRKDPASSLSLPLWKHKTIQLPENWCILHERQVTPDDIRSAQVERFFRLVHTLENLKEPMLPEGFTIRTLTKDDDEALVEQINRAYESQGISVSMSDLKEWRSRVVYDESLWFGIFKEDTLVASLIMERDLEVGEAVIEWLQVTQEFLGKGLAKSILRYGLKQSSNQDDFVTVSGSLDNPSNPIHVYRSVGFVGEDIWYVIKKTDNF